LFFSPLYIKLSSVPSMRNSVVHTMVLK
jgi:hypothetical protein